MSKELEALNKMGTVSEILVDLSKSHITEKEAIRQIRKLNIGDNYSIIKKSLKPPTEEEVCKALSEYYGKEVIHGRKWFSIRLTSTRYRYIKIDELLKEEQYELIEIIARFYKEERE